MSGLSEVSTSYYNDVCKFAGIEPVEKSYELESFSELSVLSDADSNVKLTAGMQVLMNELKTVDAHVTFDKSIIDLFISRIDKKISMQMDEILHHPEFQKLESIWTGLKSIIKDINSSDNILVDILDVEKDELIEDFSDSPDVSQSTLYKQVYTDEYDMPGGNPISSMIGNFEFDSSSRDISLLTDLSKVASSAHAPFVGAVGAKFFNKNSMEDVANIPDIAEYMDRSEFIKWNMFRKLDDSRYIGLVMPKYLLRQPYGADNPVKSFSYKEMIGVESADDFLWGNACNAFAKNLCNSHKSYGWTVNIRGPESGGKVYDLSLHRYEPELGGHYKIPTEMVISETFELKLSELGFIPLCYYKGSDFACFFSANSSHNAPVFDCPDATANSRINARLPYVYLASRLAHYLKVIQRESIGSSKDKSTLERDLNRWLSSLVTKMPNPEPELVAKRPIKEGYVQVYDVVENPGFYKVNLFVTPHFQVEGIDVKLSLVSKMPTGE